MPPKKELCRNFQRGSCRYGDKCRFLHSTQQQPKANPFGFGVQNSSNFHSTTQQPNTNPFGFGVQNVSQQNGGGNFGPSRQANVFKPFENKWTRTSSTTGGSSNTSQQNQNQPQPSNHKCTDPNECKKIIASDFKEEQPLWKLTCYGHFKHLPCDISGDTSYEELRAAAYDDAKRGMPLQSIVERERNLQQSKLIEFENLLRNPYTKQANSAQPLSNPFPSIAPNPFQSIAPNPSPMTTQNQSPSPFSSFGQPATSFGMSSSMSSPKPSSNPFGFGQTNNTSQTSAMFGSASMASGNPGGGGPFGTFSTQTSSFSNTAMCNQNNLQPPTSFLSQNISTANNLQPVLSNPSGAQSNGFGQPATNNQPSDNMPKATSAGDASIWLKKEWKLGEIPEDIPPIEYIR